MEQRRALHQGVVHVEERRRGQVDGGLLGAGGLVGLDVYQRALGAGVGGQLLQFQFSWAGPALGPGSTVPGPPEALTVQHYPPGEPRSVPAEATWGSERR